MEPQEMDSKYFTPAIEDIRVGYECESHEWCMDELGTPELNYDRWAPIKLSSSYITTLLTYGIKKNNIRVPYLTKEQIEAEGWESIEALDDDGAFSGTKSRSGIIYKATWSSDFVLYIWDTNFETCVYYGECKDLNTFRYLCNLLGI